jgi:predicted AAA+ superfamily ATPase
LELDNIRNAEGNTLGLAKQTVERYLELLEKTFVIEKVRGFSRNLRKEIAKSSRYYFLDNGVRSALIL